MAAAVTEPIFYRHLARAGFVAAAAGRMRCLRRLGSLSFLDGMLGAMERESGLVVVGDGRVLA